LLLNAGFLSLLDVGLLYSDRRKGFCTSEWMGEGERDIGMIGLLSC
ncbi:3915_t:CDS:1, partial [Acaulospora morrowiae]